MKLTNIVTVLLTVVGFSSQAQAILLSNQTLTNPIMDGVVDPGEWAVAGSEPDGNGLAGSTYAMWQDGLNYNSGSYVGKFSFLLHNIEQNITFGNGSSGNDPAFNVFDIFAPGDFVNKLLDVTVFYDGFTVQKYDPVGSVIDSKSFLYGVDLAPDQTDSYNWDSYFGVYARGGYGNSAFTSGLDGAVNDANQLFEIAYLNPNPGPIEAVRRSLKDPDQQQNWEVVTYLDTTVVTVPEPASFALLSIGFVALGFSRRRKTG